MHRGVSTNLRSLIAGAIGALCLVACSKDDPAGNNDPLCAGESGVGIRVEGRAEPIDVCVSDSAVDALLTTSQHYDLLAQVAIDDGSIVQLHLVFTHRADAPITLRLVNSITEATSDPSTVYVSYEEAPEGGTPVRSSNLLGGKFRLTFNDDKVAVGTLENIRMDMNNVQTGDPAGERQIVEGFFSVSVSPPVAFSAR